MSLPSSLRALITEFSRRADPRACADPNIAYGGCLTMAMRFAAAARAMGHRAEVLELSIVTDDGDLAGRHYLTEADGWGIDWTAAQFARPGEQVPLPLVVPPGRTLNPLSDLSFDQSAILLHADDPVPAKYLGSQQPDWEPGPFVRHRG